MSQESANQWTVEQREYQEWLALPRKARNPKTQAALAKKLKSDPATLWRWSQKEGWWEAVNAIKRQAVKGEFSEVFDALVTKAKSGDVPAIKLFMEMIDEYVQKQETNSTHRIVDLERMSDAQLAAIIAGSE